MKKEGYTGAVASVYGVVAHFPAMAKAPIVAEMVKKAIPPLSARSAMWLMMKQKEKLSERKGQLLAFLLTHHGQAKMAYPIALKIYFYGQKPESTRAGYLDSPN